MKFYFQTYGHVALQVNKKLALRTFLHERLMAFLLAYKFPLVLMELKNVLPHS
jgi:hypothetical protein